jgi:hypothetical protein
MKKLIILSLLIIVFSSCKNDNKKVQETSAEKDVVTTESSSSLLQLGCYSYNANNNAINLEITNLDNGVKGELTYAYDGKDSNSGSINGTIEGDKLFAEYTFMSEGVESKREIAFLIKDDTLIEGYGELNENGTALVDKNSIKYNSTMPLAKTDCDKWRASCLFINGKVYSHLRQSCLELTTLNIKLNPLKNVAMAKGKPAFLLFDNTKSKVELFLPNSNKGIVMDKTNEGNWSNGDYKLIAWKGYVLQEKGIAVFGGE